MREIVWSIKLLFKDSRMCYKKKTPMVLQKVNASSSSSCPSIIYLSRQHTLLSLSLSCFDELLNIWCGCRMVSYNGQSFDFTRFVCLTTTRVSRQQKKFVGIISRVVPVDVAVNNRAHQHKVRARERARERGQWHLASLRNPLELMPSSQRKHTYRTEF
jgi:hypothetical protein